MIVDNLDDGEKLDVLLLWPSLFDDLLLVVVVDVINTVNKGIIKVRKDQLIIRW